MNKKFIKIVTVISVAIYCFLIPINITKANEIGNDEFKSILNNFFKEEKLIRNDIYIYGENVYVNASKNLDNQDTVKYLKYILNRIDTLEREIDISKDKYKGNSVEGRYISATKVILGYYRNAVYELLLYIDETKYESRFEALDRYFFNRYTGKNTAEWLKSITTDYQK